MSSEDEVRGFVRRAIAFAQINRDLPDQAALGARFGVHAGTVNRMNNGHWSPAQTLLVTVLVEFCQALHRGDQSTPTL